MSNLLAEIARRRRLEAIRGKPRKSSAFTSVLAPAAAAATGHSLNDVLQARGFTTTPAAPGRKNVLDGRGHIVLENVAAHEVWDWLRTGHNPSSSSAPRKRAKKKKRKPKKRGKAEKAASTPKPAKKKPKKKRAKKAKKKAAKKKRAKSPKKPKRKKAKNGKRKKK